MSTEQKLQLVFPNQFQVNRVIKEMENLLDVKSKMGLEIRYHSRQHVQFSIIVEMIRQKIKENKKLAFLNKIQFKIVLKNTYPTEPPRVYFLIENAIQIGINPFHNYLKLICPEWGPKVSIIDIIKLVPDFLIQCNQKSKEIIGEALIKQYFEAERLISFKGCQIFPVKLLRGNIIIHGMIGVVNGEEIVLLQQSNSSNSYISTDFIKISEVYSVQKHKVKHLRALLEVKRNGKKYGVEFSSDEFETIIGVIVQQMKALAIFDKEKLSSSDQSDEEVPAADSQQTQDFIINQQNIGDVQNQILILQSLVDSKPNSSEIKELVDLLKKAVEYYSITGNDRCQIHLRSLQSIMNNEFMQVMLASEDTTAPQHQKNTYQSIAHYV